MSLFNTPKEDRARYVALCLGLDPDKPTSWPMNTINRIIDEVEYESHRAFMTIISKTNYLS